MFERFGEFDSCGELNNLAEELMKKGDEESILALAKENGIDREDAQDYIQGIVPTLATPLAAAYGKLAIECEYLKPREIIEDWVSYIKIQCLEAPGMAEAARKKGRSLEGCIAALLAWSYKNAYSVDEKICRAAGVKASVKMGIPGMERAKKIIMEYYMKEVK